MAKVDKYFIGSRSRDFDFLDKATNVNNNIAYMLNRTNTMFKYTNLPQTIPSKEIELLLQTNGFGVFVKIEDDFYIVNGGLGGETDVYNRPTKAVISVPSLSYNETLEIGTECIIVNNDSLGVGLLPLYQKYSTVLNENMISMILANVNKRVVSLISANDDNTVASAELYLKNIFDGKQGVIAESKLFDSLKVNPTVSKDGTLKELIEFEQYMKASLYNEVGLSANYNMKKERVTKEEFTTNSDSLFPLVDDMLNSRRKALEEINSLFELDIMVEFNSSWNIRNLENDSLISGLEQDKDTNIEDTIEDDVKETIEENVEEPIEETIEETIEDEIEDTIVEDDTGGTDEVEEVVEEVVEDDVEVATDEEIEPTEEENEEDEEQKEGERGND